MSKIKASMLVVILASSITLVYVATLPENVSASVLYVGGEGPGNYSAIKYAVADANPRDTIYVYWGDYYENIVVGKPLSIVGQERVNTVIHGSISVEADYVNITGFTIVLDETSIELNYVRNCRITNTFAVQAWYGIRLIGSSNNVISGNLLQANIEGISLVDSWNNHITDNIVEYNVLGIHLMGSNNNHIVGNSVSENYDWPIYIEDSENVIVSKNNISKNEYGIYLEQSVNTMIIDNHIYNNSYATYSDSSSNTTILGNDIADGFTGVRLVNCSTATIAESIVASVNGSGIYVESSNAITITDNSISDSNIGTDLHLSTNVTVYHNNFINNTVQARDDLGMENSWDDGYPSGGNHWSDYAGLDDFSGPNQDQPGSDNIGDEPYVIDNNSTDRYPLVFTYGLTRPPEFLSVILSGGNLENVTLMWSLSPDDGGGLKSVTGYELYRGTSYDPVRLGYQLIASLPNGASEYIDLDSGEGNPDSYFYLLCAVDIYNDTSCTQNQAGKFTRSLPKGLNLISVPLVQSDESMEYALQTVEYNKAWLYDSFSREWKSHCEFKPYRTLGRIDHSAGMWINATEDSNLTVAGIIPAQTIVQLVSGWNLIGFPSFKSAYTVSDLKMATGAVRVEGYDLMPPFYLRVLGDAEALRAGQGYWVRVEVDTDWIVEVS